MLKIRAITKAKTKKNNKDALRDWKNAKELCEQNSLTKTKEYTTIVHSIINIYKQQEKDYKIWDTLDSVKQHPLTLENWTRIHNLYFDGGQEKIDYYKQALQIQEQLRNNKKARSHGFGWKSRYETNKTIAEAYLQRNDTSKAIKFFTNAIKEIPKNSLKIYHYNDLYFLYHHMAKKHQKIKYKLTAKKYKKEAIKVLGFQLKIEPSNSSTLENLITENCEIKQFHAAIQIYLTAVFNNPVKKFFQYTLHYPLNKMLTSSVTKGIYSDIPIDKNDIGFEPQTVLFIPHKKNINVHFIKDSNTATFIMNVQKNWNNSKKRERIMQRICNLKTIESIYLIKINTTDALPQIVNAINTSSIKPKNIYFGELNCTQTNSNLIIQCVSKNTTIKTIYIKNNTANFNENHDEKAHQLIFRLNEIRKFKKPINAINIQCTDNDNLNNAKIIQLCSVGFFTSKINQNICDPNDKRLEISSRSNNNALKTQQKMLKVLKNKNYNDCTILTFK
ncbi:MAG: hypothetical protein PVI75_05800 [Gammaproteobacteria bacterium]|jgi:tetratricopeptide (TPR) repeat protein